ncbi:hypothetical protein [Georgenia sp. SUBG003]|uniref:hypothetical protein n=1 Tax=Georgenia sp. SUBG003 TaxID=1497974 RepID=UPI003AB3D60B
MERGAASISLAKVDELLALESQICRPQNVLPRRQQVDMLRDLGARELLPTT